MLVKSQAKYIQSLGQKKSRDEEGVFIAEGPKIVSEMLKDIPSQVKQVYALRKWLDEQSSLPSSIDVIEISDSELARISQLSTPNQVLAVLEQFEPAPVDTKNCVTLVLDMIQDPGNLGTIIRTADWFGINQVVCSPGCADLYNPKTVQSTMASIARVNVHYADLPRWLSKVETPIYAAVLKGEDITKMKKPGEAILVIGNESKGISSEVMELVNVQLTIPGKGNAESLNAAVAAGIILSYLVK